MKKIYKLQWNSNGRGYWQLVLSGDYPAQYETEEVLPGVSRIFNPRNKGPWGYIWEEGVSEADFLAAVQANYNMKSLPHLVDKASEVPAV